MAVLIKEKKKARIDAKKGLRNDAGLINSDDERSSINNFNGGPKVWTVGDLKILE